MKGFFVQGFMSSSAGAIMSASSVSERFRGALSSLITRATSWMSLVIAASSARAGAASPTTPTSSASSAVAMLDFLQDSTTLVPLITLEMSKSRTSRPARANPLSVNENPTARSRSKVLNPETVSRAEAKTPGKSALKGREFNR